MIKANNWKKVSVLIFVGIISLVSTAQAEPKNVIIFIGDGMGPEQVKAGGIYVNGAEGTLSFELFPYSGELTTYSANASVTDSAAASTALATGIKVNNGVISMAYPGDHSELETLLEYSKLLDKGTGLVTTTYMAHATPAGFGAHESDRNNYSQIANDYLTQTRPNVLFGGNSYMGGAAASGYTVVTDYAGMSTLDTENVTMVSGQFGSGYMPYEFDGLGSLPHLSEMTMTALAILDNDPDGFFLMVEGGRIDHASHDNDIERTVHETIEFANAVQEAIDWAAGRTDTLIIVCADHETGGLTVTGNHGAGNYPSVSWSSTGHTAANVPVYAWGENAELISGEMDNTEMFGVVTATFSPEASNPSPADSATGVDIDADLAWTAGADAVSHDVYFGISATPPFVLNQTETTYEPGTLVPNTTYYWAIDERDSGGGVTPGAVWSFTTAPVPGQASNPNPADVATDVSLTVDLSWTAGNDATSHDVYFGTSDPPEFVQNQAGTTYDPGTLAGETTYYWQIDEAGPGGNTTGGVWSFTTEAVPDAVADSDIPVKGTIGGSYLDTQASDDIYETITERESGGKPSNRHSTLEHKWTINVVGGDTVTFYVEALRTDSQDGDYFVFAYSTDDSSYTDMITVTKIIDDNTAQSYVLPASTTGTVYIRVIDTDSTQGNRSLDTVSIDYMYIKCTGVAVPDTVPPTPDPMTWASVPYATGSRSIAMLATTAIDDSGVEYYFTCTAGGGHDSGWQDSPAYEDTGLTPETSYTYTVKARDKSTNQNETQPSTEASATTDPPSAPGEATDPTPTDGQTRVNNRSVILSWIAGTDAVSHDVYLGTDYHLVLTADQGYEEFLGNQTQTTYDPPTLEKKTTYYWRIDEVNSYGTTAGVVWSFTTR
ncbi:MAG: alkaline phosphatase [Planctomycetota bacterium]|jgi:alkaline phosphatase